MRKIENVSSRLATRNVCQSCRKKLLRAKKKRNKMWENLGELNKKFKDIKKHERAKDKKMSATIVH